MKNIIKFKKNLFIPILVIFVISLSSCYNDYGLNSTDFDVVLTVNDSSTNYLNYKTFIIPDSVVQLGGSTISNTYSALMLNTFINQLKSRGYRQIFPTDSVRADLVALVTVTSSNNYVYNYDYWGYWGWYGWTSYYPFGPGYGYYPVYSGYSFTSGTMLMNLIDVAKTDTINKKVGSIWLGAINGVIDGNNQSDRIINGVNQAFTQSPYIRTY